MIHEFSQVAQLSPPVEANKYPDNYPEFCKNEADKTAYDTAVEGGFSEWVLNVSDIRAIQHGCTFDIEAGRRVEKFFLLLHHSKGEWANLPLVLQDWQRDRIIYPLFCWKRPDGTRRFRKGLIFTPKKSGKSTLGAAISLYLLVADGEPGAEVYNAAVDRSNTMNVFGEASNMVKVSGVLSKRLEIFSGVKRIIFPTTKSWYQALSADAATAEGKNIHGLIYDELHSAPGRDLWRALQGGGVGRRQPLFLAITTAGKDTNTLCFQEYEYAKKVLAGVLDDDSYFGFIAEADPKDDPGDPKTWAKANPGYGVTPKADALADLWQKAKGSPEDERDFKQYHLNLWVEKAQAAIPLQVWDVGGQPFDINKLLGKPCFGGLDLGATSDMTVLVLVFPPSSTGDGNYRVLPYFFCPEDRSRDRGKKKISYLQWIKDQVVIPTPGNTIDSPYVRAKIRELADKFQIKALVVDAAFQGADLCAALQDQDGLPVIPFRCAMLSMAMPTRKMMELIMAGKLQHGGHRLRNQLADNGDFLDALV